MLKPNRCNNTADLTRSVVKGLKCFNLVLIWNYDTNSSLGKSRGDPALLTTPLTLKPDMYIKYTLSLVIGWVLPRLESHSRMSPICVLGESHVTQYSILWVPCVSQNYLSDIHALGIYVIYLDMWVPYVHRFVNRGHGWLLYPGTPLLGSLRH